ncbi:MAG: toll/interleukin-1 receptor domain-containing protein [Bacteroidales bacterium]|nr:toll/interleukin-1 receptor domain-containing protein [Bacteroidales bacterium]
MGQSVLVFISHSSEDKESLIEPIVQDLEDCYINVWIDKRKIVPGDNLRKSIFRDGLDKADVALIFFTQKSLQSSWVDKEIKHVLREESKKGNNFDLNKIISIFDSQETYEQISERYPELTDDLLHLMPTDYTKIQLCQLVSAIWSKYLSLQGGDVETQRQLLAKEKEIFQKEKEISELKSKLAEIKLRDPNLGKVEGFQKYVASGKLNHFIRA